MSSITISGISVKVSEKFVTREGRLTHYALACGYLETKEINHIRVTLWHEGGPCFHVRCHDFNFNIGKRLSWECFEKLTQAREHFDLIVASLKGV